jgi:hypothetical protein
MNAELPVILVAGLRITLEPDTTATEYSNACRDRLEKSFNSLRADHQKLHEEHEALKKKLARLLRTRKSTL